jgi:competence protein ComEA
VCLAFFTVALLCPAQESKVPDEAAKQVFRKVCGNCHPAEGVTATRRTQAQWEEAFFNMITEQGAKGTDDEFTLVFDYLLSHYGRVNVNRAPAREITAVLGLTAKDADAIVGYRAAQGEFPDFDSLLKVPGIDTEKLKQGRDAVSF